MSTQDKHAGNVLLLRGAALWLLVGLLLAWCLIAMMYGFKPVIAFFSGNFRRVLQAHLDFLMMTALIFGIYAAKVPLPWHIRWAIVVGACTNSSIFLVLAVFPAFDTPTAPPGGIFEVFMVSSIVLTTYGFGAAAVQLLRSTCKKQ